MLIETDDYLTIREAADELGVAVGTLSVQILRGNLRAIKPYGSWLVERASLAEYKARTQPDGVKSVGRPSKGRKYTGEPLAPNEFVAIRIVNGKEHYTVRTYADDKTGEDPELTENS